jgi:hypothetical protein
MNPERKMVLGKLSCVLGGNIKVEFMKIGYEK